MKTLGMIGGIGPPSTIEYYRYVVEIYRRASGRSPRIVINSIDGDELLELISANDGEAMVEYLLVEVRRLADAGAELGLVASNTAHIVFSELNARSPISLISIVEATSAAATGLTRVALFATRFTVEASIYQSSFAACGIEIIAPEAADLELIQTKYFTELVAGQFRPQTRTQLLEIAERMQSDQHIDGVILGGTELPLLLTDEKWNGLRFLNTTRIHAQAAVTQMLR